MKIWIEPREIRVGDFVCHEGKWYKVSNLAFHVNGIKVWFVDYPNPVHLREPAYCVARR